MGAGCAFVIAAGLLLLLWAGFGPNEMLLKLVDLEAQSPIEIAMTIAGARLCGMFAGAALLTGGIVMAAAEDLRRTIERAATPRP